MAASSSSLGPVYPSVITAQNPSSNSQVKDNNVVIKELALVFLGHGYNRSQEDPSHRLLNPIIDAKISDVEIREAKTKAFVAIGATEEEVVEELRKGFGVGFDLSFPPYASLGASVSYQKSSHSTCQIKKIIYATAHISQTKCVLSNDPILSKPRDELGQGCSHLVRSGWIYTGYKIFLEITAQINQETKGRDLQAGGKIGAQYGQVEFSINSLKRFLENKEVVNVRLSSDGFGDYSPPLSNLDSCDLKKIDEAITRIRDDYIKRERAHKIMFRQYAIDESELVECSQIPSRPVISSLITPLSIDPPSEPLIVPPSNGIKDFYKLADEILKEVSTDYRKSLRDILEDNSNQVTIGDMLDAIQTVFPKIFQNGMDRERSLYSHTLVMGSTGSGKSTIIGYQLGAKICLTEFNIAEGRRKWVFDYQANSEFYPAIGHVDSKTKGYAVWQKYIDVAGLFDTQGRAVDICNAMATSMATRIFSPNRLIIVLNSADFLNQRARGFLEMMGKLKRMLRNPMTPEVISSILFLVNDKATKLCDRPQYTEDDIINSIVDTIGILKVERDKCLGNSSAKSVFNKLKTITDFFAAPDAKTQINELSPDLAKRVAEYQEEIDILELLIKDNKDNIIVANCLQEETRRKIYQWESREGNLSSASFTMQNLVYKGFLQFKTIIIATATHFNCLFMRKTEIETLLKQMGDNIKRVSDDLHKLTQTSLTEDFQSRNDKNLAAIISLQQEIDKKNVEQQNLEEGRLNKVKERDALKSSEEPIPYDDIQPTEPIQPRSWFGAKIWTKKYSFIYRGIPLIRVKPYKPTEKGKYIKEDATKLDQGEYHVTYIPAWWGKKEDGEAVVKCFVKTKNHPSSQAAVQHLEQEVNSLDTQIKDCKNMIDGYRAQIRNLRQAISDNERAKKLVEDNQARAAAYSKELETLVNKQQTFQTDLQ